jgi:RNA polymerase sigma-70 factor (ECF subfamily)
MAENLEDNNQREFLRLFSTASGPLHTFVRCLLPFGDEADEVFQELSYRLWKNFHRYDSDREFMPWARGIARNLVLEHRRRNKQTLQMSEATLEQIATLSDESLQWSTERQNALQLCIQKLAEGDRLLLRLRYQQLMKPLEIAKAKDRSIHHVYRGLTRIHRSLLACIRQALAKGQQA